jgi:hypothetical protein
MVKTEICISYTNTACGGRTKINVSKLQWCCVGIKIQLHILLQKWLKQMFDEKWVTLWRGGIFFLSISSAISLSVTGPSWSWSYGSWIYNYPSNQCLSPLTLEFEPRSCRVVIDTTLCNTVCQWLAAGLWFSPCTPLIKLTATI